jgi:hypothetical protein
MLARWRLEMTATMLKLRTLFIGAVACATFLGSGSSVAQEEDERGDEDVHAAFQAGATPRGLEELVDVSFAVVREGRSVLLRATPRAAEPIELDCMLCSASELRMRAWELGVTTRASIHGAEVSRIVIVGAPPRALVLDGVEVTPAGDTIPVIAGDHTVRAETDGEWGPVELHLKPGEARRVELERRRWSVSSAKARAAVAVVGLGLSAAAVGAAFIALDGECGFLDDAGNCAKVHELRGIGSGLIVSGAVSQSLLIWLLWPEGHAEEEAAR